MNAGWSVPPDPLIQYHVVGERLMGDPRLGTVGNVDRAFYQGSKKLLSSSPEQVDFLAGQVTLRCLIRKGTGKSSSNKIIN